MNGMTNAVRRGGTGDDLTPGAAPDDLDRITLTVATAMFPATRTVSIAANLPHVLAGLRSAELNDSGMGLMALATIRAETERFRPIDEGQSRYNTRDRPFDRYDAGTAIGAALGNTVAGDGARFKGRGFIQLTGRANYARIGAQIGVNLIADPARANDPAIAGRILGQFLRNVERGLRAALALRDLRKARRLINGGSHGLDRFADAYTRGERALGRNP